MNLDNDINEHIRSLDAECDYQLVDAVTDSDFSALFAIGKPELVRLLRKTYKDAENVTIDNVEDYLIDAFITSDFCTMPPQFNSEDLDELHNEIQTFINFNLFELWRGDTMSPSRGHISRMQDFKHYQEINQELVNESDMSIPKIIASALLVGAMFLLIFLFAVFAFVLMN